MVDELRATERERRGTLLRRVALVAAFAIVSSAFLPLAHGVAGHAGDCGVCTVFAHGSASVAVATAAPSLPLPAAGPAMELLEPAVSIPLRPLSLRLARAPPLPAASV